MTAGKSTAVTCPRCKAPQLSGKLTCRRCGDYLQQGVEMHGAKGPTGMVLGLVLVALAGGVACFSLLGNKVPEFFKTQTSTQTTTETGTTTDSTTSTSAAKKHHRHKHSH